MARTLNKLLIYATTYSDHTTKTLTQCAVTNTSAFSIAAQYVTLKNYMQITNAAYYFSSSSYLKPSPLSELVAESNRIHTSAPRSDSKKELARELSSILFGETADSPDSEEDSDSEDTYDVHLSGLFDIPWMPPISRSIASLRHKEVSRGRKQKWLFKCTQGDRLSKLTRMCRRNLGGKIAIEDLLIIRRDQLCVKEYNAMIEVCIENARNTDDEDIALKEFRVSHKVFESMRERGFEIGEQTYGPFLMFIIDMGMVDEFYFFCENFKKENPNSLSRLAYYEMLLWIKVNDGDKIKMLIANTQYYNDECNFNEGYLVALCEWDRQEEVSMLLETIDLKKVSSKENMERIFNLLGRHSLESHAKKFILQLKTNRQGGHDLSNLIYTYAMSIPNTPIEESFMKFKNLQAELKVSSSSVPYEKLIKTYCDSLEVSMKTEITWMRDMLRGDDEFKLQVKLLKQVPEEYAYKDDR